MNKKNILMNIHIVEEYRYVTSFRLNLSVLASRIFFLSNLHSGQFQDISSEHSVIHNLAKQETSIACIL